MPRWRGVICRSCGAIQVRQGRVLCRFIRVNTTTALKQRPKYTYKTFLVAHRSNDRPLARHASSNGILAIADNWSMIDVYHSLFDTIRRPSCRRMPSSILR